MIIAIAVLAVGTFAFRFGGVLLRNRLRLPDRVRDLLPLAAIALLAALAATAALTQDGGFAGVARPAGVLAGALAAGPRQRDAEGQPTDRSRVPFAVIVVIAAATAAGLRLCGLP